MKVTINKQSVSNVSKVILENVEYLQNDVKQIENVINSINEAWEGADALKFINTMRDKYISELNEAIDIISRNGTYLSNIPKAYDLLDETFSNKNINV